MKQKTFEEQFDFFPFGTQYYREPTPLPGEWEMDIKEIARAGYTHVQYRPQWICHERLHGRFTWDDTDRLFDLADKYGVKVILKPMVECAPDWVYSELNGYRIGFNGQRIGPHHHGAFYPGGWLPCFDNPGVREATAAFVKEIASRYADHPALWFYNAWNEPRSRPLGQCQCEYSRILYREWLNSKFGPIENLNKSLGKQWMSYDTVFPPTDAFDYIQMYLWRLWAADMVASHVKLVNDAIKAGDPKAFVMTHVGGCTVIQDTCFDASDDLANSAVVDRYGTSFPVNLHPKSIVEHCAGDYISDWLRRVDEDYWCHEFYTNNGCWSIPPTPEVLNRLIWLAVSGGTAGFTFWQYRSERVGNETNGWGMRNIDGSVTPRSEVCDSIAGILRDNGSALVGSNREKSRIKLLYNRKADLISRVQCLTQSEILNSGNNLEGGGVGGFYKQAISNAHSMYLMMGETLDWVVSGDNLSDTELLHVTADEIADASCADWLRDYVNDGGKLIVEMPFACRDSNTWVSLKRPNHNLDDLLGCRESLRVNTGSEEDAVTFENGENVKAAMWRVELEPTTGKTLAAWENGAPAAVLNFYGKGMVLTLGQSLSMAFNGSCEDPAIKTLTWLLEDTMRVKVNADNLPEGVWIRKRMNDSHCVWFVFNLTELRHEITLPSSPKQIWQDAGCEMMDCTLVLKPNATWIAEM